MKQPKNRKLTAAQRAMKLECNLAWNQTFGRDSTQKFNTAQKFVDSQMIRRMVRYTPARNNILSRSPVLGTKIGSGHICYLSPYGRYQYYGKLMVSRLTGSAYARRGESKVLTDRDLTYSKLRHPQAQAKWFEVTKSRYGAQILRGAAAIAGGRAKPK